MSRNWRSAGTVAIGLGKRQLAFLRGYLDGLPLPVLGRRYLSVGDSDLDLRVLKAHLKSIRQQVMVIGERGGREFKDARLLLLDPDKLRSTATQPMSLEEFRQERDPYEMYSESELLEIYQEALADAPPDRRAQRNERIRRRQVAVLSQFEHLLHADPSPKDGVAGWLEPSLASRLIAAEIPTLGKLVAVINEQGYWWFKLVPGVGEKVARSLATWLASPYIATSLKTTVGPHALKRHKEHKKSRHCDLDRLRAPSSGIAPIEAFVPPARFAADREAVLAWLDGYKAKPSTYRAYRKEAERLVLFAALELRKPLASIYIEQYRDFLDRLAPGNTEDWPYRIAAADWIGEPKAKRWTDRWRPFTGALSDKSRKLALDVCRTLLAQLAQPSH
ncbi:phage integrase family protein [Noviherbaspirillum galbum]|uniref:Integrase n=1 Tax=Noviherbaspirillum galbum TaxID=2709383 RepID=A0A6B3SGX1_9BURK|nr:phage integrase family protein [Noviherbaspirillum galbum]NEX60127.1 hypothetical protein [Noviherbaspirillum galbum]